MRSALLILCLGIVAELQAAPVVVQRVTDTNFVANYYGGLPEFSAFVTYHNELYFTASTSGNNAFQLFKTNGANLVPFAVDPGYAVGTQFVEFQDQLYFRGDDGDGTELFRTDGQALTKYDLSTNTYGSGPRNFTVVGDRLYFEANLPDSAGNPRASLLALQDSVIAPVADMDVMTSYPWHFPVGNTVYYTANGPDGFELYRTDGGGIRQVVDANPGAADSDPWPGAAVGDDFYFTARGPAGREAYRANGESIVKLPIAADPDMCGGPVNFVPFGGNVYFAANVGSGYELYRTNGDTVTELDLNPGLAGSGPLANGYDIFGNQLLIPARGSNGSALFVIDAAGNITQQFDFHPNKSRGAFVFHHFQGEAYFEATGPDGPDLYKTDGNMLTKFEVVPDNLKNGGIAMWGAVEFHGELYFAASTSAGGELVKTDGTQITTFDLNPGIADSWPNDLQIVGDQLVFKATGADGQAIYSTDGSAIRKIAELTPNIHVDFDNRKYVLESATSFARLGDQLLFLGNTPDGFRLHRIVAAPEPPGWLLAAVLVAAVGCCVNRRRKSY